MLSPAQSALMDALERRKLLVCVGPLVSTAAGLASPLDLVERCRQRLAALGPNTPTIAVESGVATALERAEALLGSAAFVRLVREAWEPLVPVPKVARALVGLSPGLNGLITNCSPAPPSTASCTTPTSSSWTGRPTVTRAPNAAHPNLLRPEPRTRR
jgi:hypothetical protein